MPNSNITKHDLLMLAAVKRAQQQGFDFEPHGAAQFQAMRRLEAAGFVVHVQKLLQGAKPMVLPFYRLSRKGGE